MNAGTRARQLADTLLSLAVLLAFQAAGEALMWLVGRPLPGPVAGMILLAVALVTGLVKPRHVERAADLLLSRLGLLFVPPGVGVMLYADVLARDWLPLLVGTVGSLVAVLWATAATAKLLLDRGRA